jgi:hypothetical protein
MKKLLITLSILFLISLYLAIFVFNDTLLGCIKIGTSVVFASLVSALVYNLVFKNLKKSIVASFVINYTFLVSVVTLSTILFDYLNIYPSDLIEYTLVPTMFIIQILSIVLYYKKEYDWKKLVAVSVLAIPVFFISFDWLSLSFSRILLFYTHPYV